MDLRKLITEPKPGLWTKVLRIILRLLCLPYWIAARLKNFAYDNRWRKTYRSPLPTISVGNLSVGGTGKSPVVAWLAKNLRERELRVAILSRGYGGLADGRNDEALELELQLPDVPHLQNPSRAASAVLAAQELEMQVLLLDDAFQHRRIERDLDIVLLDATDPKGAQCVLPRGLYREPMSSLARADLILLTRADQVETQELTNLRERVSRWNSTAPILEAAHGAESLLQVGTESQGAEVLQGKKVAAFCGIGNPTAFFETLEGLGAIVCKRKIWPDHHAYDEKDVQSLEEWIAQEPAAELVLCTVKDWVKLQVSQLHGKPLKALRVGLMLRTEDQQVMQAVLDQVLPKSATQ
ncbi:MAG: tetraacyldisaccharide 4'-kinase [Planctomycetota bacterium]